MQHQMPNMQQQMPNMQQNPMMFQQPQAVANPEET